MTRARPPPPTGNFPDVCTEELEEGTVTENIAKTIRQGWGPKLTKAMQLPEQAQRLDKALKVAVKWMEVASEDASEMFH
jgi:hypothetical protein